MAVINRNAQDCEVLAPNGKLRVGVYPGSPISMLLDASGERRGLTIDLGAELAKQLGVPMELIFFQRQAEVVMASKAGAIDFLITNASPARALDVDFMPTLISLEVGYLVPAGSPIVLMSHVDMPEIKIGVTKGSTSEAKLPQLLTSAQVVPVANVQDGAAKLASGELQVFATSKPILFEMSDVLRGSLVLEGRWSEERVAIGIPKGRGIAHAALIAFVGDIQRSGLLAQAINRAGLRGAIHDPLVSGSLPYIS
jgi:polar amino acid transport system substrate-binding protein